MALHKRGKGTRLKCWNRLIGICQRPDPVAALAEAKVVLFGGQPISFTLHAATPWRNRTFT